MAEGRDGESGIEQANELTVLERGICIPYTVPSFPVLTALLCRVKLKYVSKEGSVEA